MATAADSASSTHSPRPSGFSSDGGLNSPQFHPNSRNLSSWTHVVRRESESVTAKPSSPPLAISPAPDSDRSPAKSMPPENTALDSVPEISDAGNSNVLPAKKPAWNKPSNSAVELGPVMGAVSWPALSESAKASPKSSSESAKSLPDGSVSVLPQAPVVLSSPQKPTSSNPNPNLNPNQAIPVRQKSFKNRGGTGGTANGNFTPPETPRNVSDKPLVVAAAAVPDSSPRETPHKNNNWETGSRGGFASQPPHIGNNQHRHSFRRGNGGPYHNNYGNRGDQDRSNFEWHSNRSFNGRDTHMQQQRALPREFIRPPPPTSTQFITPPPVRPYGSPVIFHDMSPVYYFPPTSPHESLRSVSFVAPVAQPTMFFPAHDPQLRAQLVKQIDYYFSPENLCKDIFLRQNMDEEGWVLISLISNFNRVKQLTNNIQIIMDAVRTSTVLEVQNDKIRKRNDWMNWLLQPPTVSGPQSPSSYDTMVTRLQGVGLEEGAINHSSLRGGPSGDAHAEGVLSRSSSGDVHYNSKPTRPAVDSDGEGTSAQTGYGRSMSARNLGRNESY